MARNSSSSGSSVKSKKKSSSTDSGNRTLVLVLAGFTALVILVIAGLAILSTAGGAGGTGNFTPDDQGLIKAGQKAPDFSAKTVDGSNVSLSDKGDKQATMLVFFATWCPHCQKEAPVIADFVDQYKDLRILMIGIDGQDDPQKVKEFVNQYGIESQALYNPSLGSTYNVSGYPTVYILDGNDKVVFANAGEAPRSVFESSIEKALG